MMQASTNAYRDLIGFYAPRLISECLDTTVSILTRANELDHLPFLEMHQKLFLLMPDCLFDDNTVKVEESRVVIKTIAAIPIIDQLQNWLSIIGFVAELSKVLEQDDMTAKALLIVEVLSMAARASINDDFNEYTDYTIV